jgi:putative ABC transport system permease protein
VIFLALEFEKESLRMAFDSIRQRKLRSALTVLGIVIGIAAIIALVSIGEGTNAAVSSALGSLGANTIFVASGGGGGGFGLSSATESLQKKDLTAIQSVRGIDIAVGIFVKSSSATFKDQTKSLSLFGVDTKEAQNFFVDIGVVELDQGRFFKSGERHVVVAGSAVAAKAFDTPLKVNDKFTIKDEKIQIVGILKETGQSTYDSIVIAPIEDVQETSAEKDQFTIIFARVNDPSRIDDIASDIQKKMDDLHGKKVFQVFTTKQLTEQIGTVTNMLSLVLGGIAGIALVVAGIGIANTMYMSIMERTKEIGIMKAIGASNRNVLEIFLMEAALIGLIGGIAGDILGTVLSEVLGAVLKNYGLSFSTKVTPELLGLGLAFSVIVSVVFGLLPARKAAKLRPIEALRYE